jgi:hypothetical protein
MFIIKFLMFCIFAFLFIGVAHQAGQPSLAGLLGRKGGAGGQLN